MRKRPAWMSWVPAATLLVLIGGVAVTSAVVVNSGVAGPAPPATEGQVNDLNWSVFTPEGIEYIDRSRLPRIDLADAPIAAQPLGLPDDGSLTVGPLDTGDVGLDYSLIFTGGGEYPGGGRLVVTQFTITTADGVIESIEAPLRDIRPFRVTLDALKAEAETYGWQVDTAAIFEQVEDATRAGVPYEFTLGPADRVGVPVAATASCDPTGYCSLAYEITPAVR